jgi:hypothetical protein
MIYRHCREQDNAGASWGVGVKGYDHYHSRAGLTCGEVQIGNSSAPGKGLLIDATLSRWRETNNPPLYFIVG